MGHLMKYVKRFNENFSDEHKVYGEIKKEFNQEIADIVNYQIVDILDSIPDINWTIEAKIDESKVDGQEGWLEFFEEPFVTIYKKQGTHKTMKDTELLKDEGVDLSDYIEKDVYYTAQSLLDKTGRERLRDYLISKIDGIEFLGQDDTPYDVNLVTSFKVS